VDDINRDGAACNDFFDYANGAWRAVHAIPALIADQSYEASANAEWPANSV